MSHFSQKSSVSKSNNLDMFALEANTLFLFLEVAAIEQTSKHPHMSNRIYETLDSEYSIEYIS